MPVAEEVVHNLEPVFALRVINTGYVLAALKLALRVVAQEGEDGDNAARADVEGELVLEHRELLHVFRQALEEVGAIVVQLCSSFSVRGRRKVRRCLLGERRRGC